LKKEKLLFIGLGDIACRVCALIDLERYDLFGLCRSKRDLSTTLSINCLQGDARDARNMQSVLAREFDVIVVVLTPDERSDKAYRQTYVESIQTLITELKHPLLRGPRLILFVSSTRVYGQNEGEWVDEFSQTRPSSFAGIRLREAELALLHSQLNSCVVRFSGIYGGNERHLMQEVKQGIGCARFPEHYTNRIHRDDCAGVLLHLIERSKEAKALSPLYLATDCEPASMWDVKHWMADQLGLPKSHLRQVADEGSRRSSKRCSNRLLLETGYQFRYPSFRQGYQFVIQSIS